MTTTKRGMKINYNGIRRNACRAHDKLVKALNRAIIKNDQYALPNDIKHGQEVNIKGYIVIDPEEIENVMESLRSAIGTMAMTFDEDNEDFKNVFEDLYPGEDDHMEFFNPEEE